MWGRHVIVGAFVALLLGCQADAGTDAGFDAGPPPFALTSDAFDEGGTIPTAHECGPPVIPDGPGGNETPPLSWTAGPPETRAYAIVVRDRDASDLVHWVAYDLPPSARSLPADIPAGYEPTELIGGKQAELQGSGYFGYLGMCSDGRVNTYEFAVHALSTDRLPGLSMATAENDAADIIEAMAIATAWLNGES